MADDKNLELKIKILADKKELAQLQAETKKIIAEIQKTAKTETAEINAKSKERLQQIRLEYQEKLRLIKEEQAAKRRVEAEQGKFTGQSTNIFSQQAISQMKAYLRTLDPASEQYQNLAERIREVTQAYKEQTGAGGKSTAQLLEMGENITVIAAGVDALIGKLVGMYQELYNIGLEAAQFQNMYNYFIEISGGVEQANSNLNLFKNAVAGTMNDKEILNFANKMMELGYSVEQTAQIMDISETIADNLGTTIEEGSGKLLKFIETGKGKDLYNFGIGIEDVNKKMEEMTGLTTKQIKEMDGEIQQNLRLNAVLSLKGKTIDEINNKELDQADLLENQKVLFDNLKLSVGGFAAALLTTLGGALVKISDFFGLFGAKVGQTNSELLKSQKISKDTKTILDQLNISAENMAEAYKGIETAIYGMSRAQVESAKKFVLSEIAKITALQEEAKQIRYNAMISIGDVATMEIEKRSEMFKKAWSDAQGWTADLEKLNHLLSQLNSKEQLLNDIQKGREQVKESSNKSTKKEEDLFGEIIKDINTQIELYKYTLGLQGKNYQILLKELEASEKLVDNDEKRLTYLKLRDEILSGMLSEQKFTPISKDIEDIIPITRNIAEYQRGQTFAQNTIAGIIDVGTDKLPDAVTNIKDTLTNMMSVLNLESDSFIGKMVSGFNLVLNLINGLINAVQSISAVKGLFGIIGAIFTGGASMGMMSRNTTIQLYANIDAMKIYTVGQKQTNRLLQTIRV